MKASSARRGPQVWVPAFISGAKLEQEVNLLQLGANLLIHSADILLFKKHLRADLDATKNAADSVQPTMMQPKSTFSLSRCALPAAILSLFATNAVLAAEPFTWSELAPLPDPLGFAAPYAGIAQGSLIVAGGANFPEGRPWTGAKKVWHERIFVLDTPNGVWREAGRLPRPLGYGVSLTVPDGVLCLGGSDEREHVREVFLLRREGQRIHIERYPALPRALANATGALLGTTVYVAGGIERPDSAPGRHLWALDLAQRPAERVWRELPPCPGRPRMLAVGGAHAGAFYLFSGTDLIPDGMGGLKREYLRDAWRYTPAGSWKRLADLPEARVAAPSPAPGDGAQLFIFGGDDGRMADKVSELRDDHPGFGPDVLAYDVSTDKWRVADKLPKRPGPDPARNPNAGVWPPVTTSVVPWHGSYIIPTGEVRPAVRTPRVLVAKPNSRAPGTGH